MKTGSRSRRRRPAAADLGTNSLAGYVTANWELLTALGVFTALAVFALALPLKIVGFLLAFLFIAMTLLIWFELMGRFPTGEDSWRLSMFKNTMIMTGVFLTVYWVLDFREQWDTFLGTAIWVVAVSLLTLIMERSGLVRWASRTRLSRHPALLNTVWFVLAALVVFGTIQISVRLAQSLDPVLDKAYQDMVSSEASVRPEP